MKTPEANFEKEIQIVARKYKAMYIKIPDTRMINAKNRGKHREEKRPFDGIMVTKRGNFCIECKVNNAPLSLHQVEYMLRVNDINFSHYIFRKKRLKKKTLYTVERQMYRMDILPRDVEFIAITFLTVDDLVKWFVSTAGNK